MLGHAVVVAGDRPGADIGAGADDCVADIAQVISLSAALDHCLLDLDEITDVNVVLQVCAGAQPRKGADQRPLAHVRAVRSEERRVGKDGRTWWVPQHFKQKTAYEMPK